MGCYLRQGKMSSPASHTTYPRIAWGSRAGVQSTCLHGKGCCLWSGFLLVPSKGNAAVESDAGSKGYGTQRGPKHLASPHQGEGQPFGERCPDYPTAGWSVANFCRVTWLLEKELLNSSHCPLGQLLYRLQGAGKAFFFFPKKKPNLSNKQKSPTPPSIFPPVRV